MRFWSHFENFCFRTKIYYKKNMSLRKLVKLLADMFSLNMILNNLKTVKIQNKFIID